MRLKYFIEYRYEESSEAFLPIGVWMHNPADGDVDIFHVEPDGSEAEEAMWILNRLVESGLKTPEDFLEFHQQRAGYRGMRGPVREVETELGYEDFAKSALRQANMREINESHI